MNKTCALLIGLIATVTAERALAETLKVAVAQRGFWNSTFIDVGLGTNTQRSIKSLRRRR